MTTEDELQSSSILSSFLEVTGADTVQTARHFLDITNWKLDEAIQLFFIRGSDNQSPVSSDDDSSWNDDINPPLMEVEDHQSNSSSSFDDEGRVHAPLPVRREALYGDEYDEKMELALAASREENDSHGWMYPPPTNLTYKGTFEKAKQVASMEEKWLLVNLQSKNEFSSHMLNRHTWSNEGVSQILEKNFIFWQVCDDTIEGMKLSTYYKLHGSTPPVVLLLDPITGQKMCSWSGMIEGEKLMEELVPFMDAGIKGKKLPHLHHRQQQQPRESTDLQRTIVNQEEEEEEEEEEEDKELMLAIALSIEQTLTNGDPVSSSTSTDTKMDEESPSLSSEEEETCLMEEEKKRINMYPALPEEPKTVDRKLVCRVGFRLPQDGRRVQRCFLRTDPIQLLWSFITSQLDEAEVNRPFRLTVPQGIPGVVAKALEYESKLNFEESGLSNSMILATWDD